MEREVRERLTQILTECTVNIMKLCDEYELDKDITMQQSVDMLKTLIESKSFMFLRQINEVNDVKINYFQIGMSFRRRNSY